MARYADETEDEQVAFVKHITKIVIGVVLGIIIIITLFGTFYTIPAGYRGVLLTFGKPDMIAQGEGLHFKIPFVQQIIKMQVQTQKYEADASAASKDLQTVTSKIATNYKLDPESVARVYQEIGIDYSVRVIQPAEQEIVKSITAKFTAEELITKREDVRVEIKQLLHDRLLPRGIIIEEVSITNFDFSPEFNKAIENKVTNLQAALAAQNKLEQVKYEAQQTVTKATAEAEALRLQKQQITPELLQLRQIEVQSKALDIQGKAIEKWSGVLPQVTGNNIPFISIDLKQGVQPTTPT
jgi:regulator of protease activity HflC (stomatin/prohibitin superfamily)